MFRLIKECGRARLGELDTPHGVIKTPVFMNVATCGAIRGGVSAGDLEAIGTRVVLSNTYHLNLRPGSREVRAMGGLHRFMSWNGPILTDSGGFQVFSLSKIRKISEEGVRFSSYLDGRSIFIGPEESMDIQLDLGSDIAMAFDECIALPADISYVKKSVERTTRWLERCKKRHDEVLSTDVVLPNPGQLLFGINQGGTDVPTRIKHMRDIDSIDVDGFAIGGLSVGETTEEMIGVIAETEPFMPKDKPRYLMGVGTPLDILEGVNLGIDFFDCVLPLRNAQHGNVFTHDGKMRLLAEKYRLDGRPIDENCHCPVCRRYSRGYIRHLLKADERLGMRLCILHNLYFYNEFIEKMTKEIENGTFGEYYREKREVLSRERQD